MIEHDHWGKCGIRNCIYGYPKMAGDFSGKFYYRLFCNNCAVFFGFCVVFNVLLNYKLKWYRFSHDSLIALKWRNRQEKKNTAIRVTAKDKLWLISVTEICSYP